MKLESEWKLRKSINEANKQIKELEKEVYNIKQIKQSTRTMLDLKAGPATAAQVKAHKHTARAISWAAAPASSRGTNGTGMLQSLNFKRCALRPPSLMRGPHCWLRVCQQ